LKTNKHQTLCLADKKRALRAGDLVDQFRYSAATARSYLSYLTRQDLLQRAPQGHELTGKGRDRLKFFEVSGCGDIECPSCEGKAGSFTCPTCSYKLKKEKALLRPIWETAFFKREAGVYCSRCQGQIMTESQFQLITGEKL